MSPEPMRSACAAAGVEVQVIPGVTSAVAGPSLAGIPLTHRSLTTGLLAMQLSGVMVLHNMAQKLGMDPQALIAQMPQQGVLLVYPLFHISGLGAAFLSPLFAGSKVVIMRRWDAQRALRPFVNKTTGRMESVSSAALLVTVTTGMLFFTQALPERFLRLEGINTAQGNAKVLVELYRVAFDPLKEISFISDEYNKFELEGSLLADTTKPFDAVLGQFGRIVQL